MSKVISFRVSESEFAVLKTKTQGSINDYARRIVTDCIQHKESDNDSCIQQSCDCKQDNKQDNKELVAALLQVSDLRAEIENLRAGATEKAIIEKIVEVEKIVEKNCGQCDRLAQELTDAQNGLNEKEKIIAMLEAELKNAKSSLQAEFQKNERLQSAVKQLETKNNSLKAEVSRLQSVVENTKKELAEAYAEAYNKSGIPIWLIVIGALSAVALFLLGTWV
jgi:chromosome segregation ATPase